MKTDTDVKSANGSGAVLAGLQAGFKASAKTSQPGAEKKPRAGSGKTSSSSTSGATVARSETGDLERIKGRCRIDEITGCWVWTGAMSGGLTPAIHAMDYRRGRMVTQTGQRAAWQAAKERALPKRWRVWRTCANHVCVNPDHLMAGSAQAYGEHIIRTGRFRGSELRRLANIATGVALRKVTDEQVLEVMTSGETLEVAAARLGVAKSTVARYRRGERRSSSAGIFSGLIARAA